VDWKSRWDASIPPALRLGHEQLRAELVRATMEPGATGEAAKRLALLCLPHFEAEERAVFPVFGLLDELSSGEVRPEMAEILPIVSDFRARHIAMECQHRSIASAVEALMHAAHRDKNWQCAEFAYNVTMHERLEDEVIYPTLMLIGRYVRQGLGTAPDDAILEALRAQPTASITNK
jgi:hypothetical protein